MSFTQNYSSFGVFFGLKSRHCFSYCPHAAHAHARRCAGAAAAAAAAASPRAARSTLAAAAATAPMSATGSGNPQEQPQQQPQQPQQLLASLPDAHAHPQLDLVHAPARTWALRVPAVAAMGVAAGVDWERVAQLAAGGEGTGEPRNGGGDSAGSDGSCRVIPGFGIHPWWSHLHASAAGAAWPDLLEGRGGAGDVADAVGILERERDAQRRRAGAAAAAAAGGRYTELKGGEVESGAAGGAGDGGGGSHAQAYHQGSSSTSSSGSGNSGGSSSNSSSGGGPDAGPGGGTTAAPATPATALDIVPHAEWRARLRALLLAHPRAVVGEVGIDRSAVIPGSRARVKPEHQWALFREQVALAAELRRPISVHCVRAYGHLRDFFEGLTPDTCPPAVMLHSYGGSPEEVARFSRLPGIGDRFYFSFSAAINAGARSGAAGKLAARVRAVPRDRLLLESDQVTPTLVDEGMARICSVVAAAKGWSLEETAHVARANFDRFYGGAA